jgi:hypothetical protein
MARLFPNSRMARALGAAAGVGIGGGARLEVEDGSGGPELGHKG